MLTIFFLIIYTFFLTFTESSDFSDYKKYKQSIVNFKIKEVSKNNLNYPWGMTFLDKYTLLITEKNGRLVKFNIKSGVTKEIEHNIPHIKTNFGQGGLLDVYAHLDGYIYFTYSHDHKDKNSNGKYLKNSSTAVGRGILSNDKIKNFKTLLIAKPKLTTNKHWGSRLIIKNDDLFVSFGERDKGMIAQNPQQHPGSIIRIKTDGTIPTDNPAFNGYEEWLPEIYQIGMRNPQGMAISPHDGKIYFSQHGPMGGDNLGLVKFGGNFGWKDIAWGGTEYSGKKIGKVPFKKIYDSHIMTWVPSLGIGNINFYKGEIFPEWDGDLLVSATKSKMLAVLKFENNQIIDQRIIIKNNRNIGRIRDFEIDYKGNIYLISDEKGSSIWKLYRD